MDSQHCSRVFPVCCIHTRIGDSSSVGSGVSVASVVTVGLAMLPCCNDHTVVPLGSRGEQYAVEPSAVVPVLPDGVQFAPITTVGGGAG
jgi:hypothetical protein